MRTPRSSRGLGRDRLLAAVFVVLVSSAIVGSSSAETGASFTAGTSNPGQSWNTATVAPPVTQNAAASAVAGAVNLAWAASPSNPAGTQVRSYLVLRGPVGGPYAQVGTTTTLGFTDTPPADGTYEWVIQTKIAQGAGFFTSPNSVARSAKSDRTAPTPSITCNGGSCAGWFNASVSVAVSGSDGTGVGMGTATTNVDGARAATSAAPRTVTVSGESATHSVVYSAADAVGNASSGATQTVKIDLTSPSAPGGVSATTGGGAGQLNVTGTMPGFDTLSGVAGYRVYYAQGNTCRATPYRSFQYFAGNPPPLPLVVTGLVSGANYCAYARTVDLAGNLSVISNVSGPVAAR